MGLETLSKNMVSFTDDNGMTLDSLFTFDILKGRLMVILLTKYSVVPLVYSQVMMATNCLTGP